MDREEELRTAWSLWRLLSDIVEQLWKRYEEDFLSFCIEEEDRYSKKREGDGAKR